MGTHRGSRGVPQENVKYWQLQWEFTRDSEVDLILPVKYQMKMLD